MFLYWRLARSVKNFWKTPKKLWRVGSSLLNEHELGVIRVRKAHRTEFMLQSTPLANLPDAQGTSHLTLRSLFEAEETPLLRYAFSLVGRRAVAEEIVQEVFLQLHAHWDDVACPEAWLMRSVRNKAFNHIRDHKRETLHSDDHHARAPNVEDETPEEVLLRMETAGALQQTLAELDETDQQLVRLKYFDDLSYREMAAQTGLSISNVGYRLHHILKELGRKLRPLGIDRT